MPASAVIIVLLSRNDGSGGCGYHAWHLFSNEQSFIENDPCLMRQLFNRGPRREFILIESCSLPYVCACIINNAVATVVIGPAMWLVARKKMKKSRPVCFSYITDLWVFAKLLYKKNFTSNPIWTWSVRFLFPFFRPSFLAVPRTCLEFFTQKLTPQGN